MTRKLGIFSDVCEREWFDYGSYVDITRRIFYVETPKVACSSVKHLIRNLITDRPLEFNPTKPETRASMFIHDRSQMPLPSLNQFSFEQIDDIISGPGWFRFCVVRHPFDRFFSAWRDKIFLCEPGFESYLPGNKRKFIEFSEFAESVLSNENAKTCNPHWRAQNALLLTQKIKYTKIYHLNDLPFLSYDIRNHLKSLSIEQDVEPLNRKNEGFKMSSLGFFTEEITKRLNFFYDDDFSTFGFKEKNLAFDSRILAQKFTNQLTDAIFDRNRVISESCRRAVMEREVERRRQNVLHRRIVRRLKRYAHNMRQEFPSKAHFFFH